MQKADEILDFLNQKLGKESLAWRGEHASIKFEDGIIVDLIKIDLQTVELVHILEDYAGVDEPEFYKALLIANYQRGMTGKSRLSLTPDFKTLSICCRIDVRGVDDALFEDTLTEFLKYIHFWKSQEAADYLLTDDANGADKAIQYDPDEYMTRV